MKNLLYSLLTVLLLVYVGLAQSGQTKADLIPSDEKFTKEAVIKETYVGRERLKTESGSLNDITYRFFYSDGSGSFLGVKGGSLEPGNYRQNWQIGCKKDAIEDTKLCFMKISSLLIVITGKDKYSVSIGSDNYPGTPVAIRIDGGEPIKGGTEGIFTGAESDKILAQLKKGKEVITRHQKFPKEYSTDDTFELYGFNETFQYINWAFSKIK